MKKYKLIKSYPGCDYPSGTVIDTKFIWINGKKVYLKNCPEFWEEIVENHSVFHIGNSLTENHPGGKAPYYIYQDKESYCKENNIKYFYCKKDCEKWANEQVIEKDYEILSVKSIPLGSIWTCVKNSTFGISYKGDVFYCNGGAIRGFEVLEDLNKGRYSIYSVKRLSDGEVFTVGDLCNPIGEYSYNKHKITTIEFCKTGSLRIGSSNYYIGINMIEHSKKPLFTTEDGVDIFEGDKYFELALTFKPQFREAIYEGTGRPDINYDYNTLEGKKKLNEIGRYYFSTKEAAEEYIISNKPCLSINELCTLPGLNMTNFREKLGKLVKSKL